MHSNRNKWTSVVNTPHKYKPICIRFTGEYMSWIQNAERWRFNDILVSCSHSNQNALARPDLAQWSSALSLVFHFYCSSYIVSFHLLFSPPSPHSPVQSSCLKSMNRHDVGQLLAGRIEFNYSCKCVRCFDYHLLKHFLCTFSGGAQSYPDPTFKLNKYHSTFRYGRSLYHVYTLLDKCRSQQNIAVQSFNGREECHLAKSV